jgi:hypothetical protein
MAVMIAKQVDLNEKPEPVVWRRTFIPTGELGEFAQSGIQRSVNFDGSVGTYNVGKEFTDAELEVIRNTPFLAARIESSMQVPTPIGYRDNYKNRASLLDARQIYNFATKNPLEFLKSELPAYLGAGDANASIKLIQAIKDAGEPVKNLQGLYESALQEAPKYVERFDEYYNRKRAENPGPSSGVGKFVNKFIGAAVTTVGAIAGGPPGAAVLNAVLQLGQTGKIDPRQVALAYGAAYIASGGPSQNLTASIQAATGLSAEAAKVASGAVLGAGISAAAGGDPIKGAFASGIGSIGSTTYATSVGNALGVTSAVAAPIVGNAVISASLSGIAAAVTGGDVEKSMLDGAVKGAAFAGSKEFTEAVLGKDNIARIADITGLTDSQVANVFTTSVANGITAEITGQGEFLETAGISLASQGVGAKARNIMEGAVSDVLKKHPEIRQGVLTATSGIAGTATNAALSGQDVGKALEDNAAGIILSSVQSYRSESDLQNAIRARTSEALLKEEQQRQEQENILISQIQEAAQREFGPATSEIELAQYSGATPKVNISGVLPLIYVGDTVTINDAGVIFDKASGNVVGELNESELLDLRKRLGLSIQTGDLITDQTMFGGTSGEIGTTRGGGGGTEGGTEARAAAGTPSGLPEGVDFENPEVLDLMAQQQFFRDQIDRISTETGRLGNLREELQAGLEQVSPAGQTQIRNQIEQITNEVNRLNDIAARAAQGETAATENLTKVEAQLAERTAAETERVFGRIERQTAAEQRRFEQEQADFEKELEALESDLNKAESEKQIVQNRQQFVAAQRERLAQRGRFTGTLQQQVDAEINDLLDQYEAAQERASTAATRREGLAAPQQIRPGGQGISDEDVIRLLGLDESEAGRYGFEIGDVVGGDAGGKEGVEEPAFEPEEQPPEGEMELGGGEGEGEPPTTRFDAQGRPVAVSVIREGGREAGTPAISTRVTGEALEGILGEKEPLFGGDEDEQRAVWNRRSLRLRKALGL